MNDLQKIKDYFDNIREVIAVYLFGSYALGREIPFSDIDLGIIFNESDKEILLEKRNQYIVELGRLLRKDIHPVIMNLAAEEVLRQIFSKGKPIQVNDAKALSHFKTYAFVKMAEFGYYRTSMQRGVIRKLQEEVGRA